MFVEDSTALLLYILGVRGCDLQPGAALGSCSFLLSWLSQCQLITKLTILIKKTS